MSLMLNCSWKPRYPFPGLPPFFGPPVTGLSQPLDILQDIHSGPVAYPPNCTPISPISSSRSSTRLSASNPVFLMIFSAIFSMIDSSNFILDYSLYPRLLANLLVPSIDLRDHLPDSFLDNNLDDLFDDGVLNFPRPGSAHTKLCTVSTVLKNPILYPRYSLLRFTHIRAKSITGINSPRFNPPEFGRLRARFIGRFRENYPPRLFSSSLNLPALTCFIADQPILALLLRFTKSWPQSASLPKKARQLKKLVTSPWNYSGYPSSPSSIDHQRNSSR
ncbi:hypothetical protein PGT21_020010 [Puccinia graminis f. sp. tritici]|uniref:Uncharacterized protein n=1 Tax=Puccinia graminis f. sp. tritici TaxID=56615 RepID=A0A5B0QAY3_PUCGR|nr:hypothetical protein PGT21_020010 [Puccinia graminis f. sp. tritici]